MLASLSNQFPVDLKIFICEFVRKIFILVVGFPGISGKLDKCDEMKISLETFVNFCYTCGLPTAYNVWIDIFIDEISLH